MISLTEKLDGKICEKNTDTVTYHKSCDILVCGIGAAGTMAVISAAKEGKRVIAIDKMNAPGGTMTMGGICGYYFGGKGGIYEETDTLINNNASDVAVGGFRNTDYRKAKLDDAVTSSGAECMYECIVTGVYKDNRKITGVRVFDGQKEINISLKVIIDATGDAEVADISGCKTLFGRDDSGSVMPYSVIRTYLEDGMLKRTNHDCGKEDQRDPYAFSASLLKAQAEFCKHAKKEQLVRLQSLPGIREGRLIDGEEKITLHDVLSGNFTDKPVIYAYSDLDKHGIDLAFDSELFKKWHILANLGAMNVTIPVPLGALVPKEYDNFLVSGRCLSMDHEIATHIRMNRDMQKIGEVSGIAAALLIDYDVPSKDVPYHVLKAKLEKTGCLSEDNNKGFYYDSVRKSSYNRKAEWFDNISDIDEALSTLSPGVGIWSCYLMRDGIKDHLVSNLSSDNDKLKKHSAIALALMGYSDGVSILRDMIVNRDRTMLTDMRKQNKRHISQALCALGILKDKDSIDIILDVVCDKGEHTHYEWENGFNPCYYRTLSTALAALLEITEHHSDRREEVLSKIKRELTDYSYISRITDLGKQSAEYVQARELYDIVINYLFQNVVKK